MRTVADNINDYRPAIQLTKVLSRRTMTVLRQGSFICLIVFGVGSFVSYFFFASAYLFALLGATILFSSVWLEQILTYCYHNSYYFRGLNSLIGIHEESFSGASYDVAEVVLKNTADVASAFCTSPFGQEILLRSGLTPEQVNDFLSGHRKKITAASITVPDDDLFSLIGLGKYLLTHDVVFREMFKKAGIQTDTFLGALRWVIGTHHQYKRQQRWWSKDNLSRTTSIGAEWAFGSAYLLKKFSRDIRTTAVFSTLTTDAVFAEEKVRDIESALVREKAANVLIIGEAGVGKIDLVMEIAQRIKQGKALAAITSKELLVLDTNRLFATHKDKQSLELTLINMFTEAAEAGNVIVVIENISTFIREATALGVFIPELLDEFLALPDLQIIATDTPGAYHTHLETLGTFVRRFAEILIDSPDLTATTRLLQSVALQHEAKNRVLFTYAGLHAITTAANQYIVEGVMPDKAIGLLVDVATAASQQQVAIITDDFVYQIVSQKTGVPAGPIQDSERDILLHLEDRLHQQVIGQQAALTAIASTMRRARAGIQSTEKPIGSFLFLGPTGVGKTETAKALAHVFFGGEDNMQRLDMSEYSGEDATERLIGDGEHPGTLSNMLREHPYSVLLLDEFEKADQSVHDIFLQILDEGTFTDARGIKINARNTIIIATTNAGSELILRTVSQRKELTHLNQKIIDNIISEGIFRPELLNRFDNTIVFEPLAVSEQTEVASLMLGGLQERIKERGYELTVGDELMTLLVEKGYHPRFGARPMQRVLQDVIEEKVAQKIIAGSVQKGETLRLTRKDFTEEELAIT